MTKNREDQLWDSRFVKTIKSLAPGTQVIMITAFAHLNTAIEALRGQVFDFFPKPFKIKDFVDSVRRAAQQSGSQI